MKDLELAKQLLKENNLSLVIVKNGKVIFQTKTRGIRDFLQVVEKIGSNLAGASVADRIVGRAVALLCIYSGIKAVFAVVISEEAMALLKKKQIYCEAEVSVPHILDKNKTVTCPFEKAVANIDEPRQAYRMLMECMESREESTP